MDLHVALTRILLDEHESCPIADKKFLEGANAVLVSLLEFDFVSFKRPKIAQEKPGKGKWARASFTDNSVAGVISISDSDDDSDLLRAANEHKNSEMGKMSLDEGSHLSMADEKNQITQCLRDSLV